MTFSCSFLFICSFALLSPFFGFFFLRSTKIIEQKRQKVIIFSDRNFSHALEHDFFPPSLLCCPSTQCGFRICRDCLRSSHGRFLSSSASTSSKVRQSKNTNEPKTNNNRIFPFFVRFQSSDGDSISLVICFSSSYSFLLYFALLLSAAAVLFFMFYMFTRIDLESVLCSSNNLQLSIIQSSVQNERVGRLWCVVIASKILYRHNALWTKSFFVCVSVFRFSSHLCASAQSVGVWILSTYISCISLNLNLH